MNTKIFLCSTTFFLLSSCSSEQRFVCGNEGLVIKNNSATLGVMNNLKLCSKEGTVSIYSNDCSKDAKSPFVIFFDTVSLNLRESGNFLSTQCKKI